MQYRDGVTCAADQAMKGDNFDIQTWLSEDSANRALCPSCATPIEKNGGRFHMVCKGCLVHMCWTCKAMFRNERETHDHLCKCHGGIFHYVIPPNP